MFLNYQYFNLSAVKVDSDNSQTDNQRMQSINENPKYNQKQNLINEKSAAYFVDMNLFSQFFSL